MTDLSPVGAAVAAGLLSGGGAGYLVSFYTARKESKDRKDALQLERDKFDHEREKYAREIGEMTQQKTSTVLAQRRALLRQTDESLRQAYKGLQVPAEDLIKAQGRGRSPSKGFREFFDPLAISELSVYGYPALSKAYRFILMDALALFGVWSDKDPTIESVRTTQKHLATGIADIRAIILTELEALEKPPGPI